MNRMSEDQKPRPWVRLLIRAVVIALIVVACLVAPSLSQAFKERKRRQPPADMLGEIQAAIDCFESRRAHDPGKL